MYLLLLFIVDLLLPTRVDMLGENAVKKRFCLFCSLLNSST